jgi:hypothetical protein
MDGSRSEVRKSQISSRMCPAHPLISFWVRPNSALLRRTAGTGVSGAQRPSGWEETWRAASPCWESWRPRPPESGWGRGGGPGSQPATKRAWVRCFALWDRVCDRA